MEHLNSSQQTQSVAELSEQKTSLMEPTATTPTELQRDINKPERTRRRFQPLVVLGVFLGAGAIASGVYAYRWLQYAQQYPQTDYAYVAADTYSVTSRVAGVVTSVAVSDNQMVSPGMLLVKIDPGEYQAVLNQAKASLELAKQQAALARENLQAATSIPAPAPIPTPVTKNASGKPAAIKPRIVQPPTINQQTQINQQQYKTALAAVAQKQAEVKAAELQLSYANVTALVPGKVGSKNVTVGQRVQPGQTLITVVQPNPWIVANFRETQLEKIQPGQKVSIKIPAFPNQKFQGKVDSMAPTSFGKVSPLPQENAAGNQVKNNEGVQRIPVKILLEPQSIKGYETRLTPGMSAVATVQTK
ncbi:HlyD family secretion protein [Iningainema tapete]|uniref:HlyD family secretion protein n=1 Tax=Iningainema tapete BLCC-T55 TaxID=2748662 RepID=A0A8J6XS26_9CYAN|nr:HlyD family secretion protein [Iningainema tapete]MBD2777289.1 HlyD family secretion protein [Iningainema tapete BLCC-T55]